MDDAAPSCPTCGTALAPGAFRCPGCGRVLGETNRCPHCNAIAGVLRRGPWNVCAACGGRRDIVEGTVVLEDLGGGARLSSMPPPPATAPSNQTAIPPTYPVGPQTPVHAGTLAPSGALAVTRREGLVGRGSAIFWRIVGGVAIASAIVGGGLLAIVVPGVGGFIAAGAASLLGLGSAALALGAARKGDRAAARASRATLEQAVIAAAVARDGSITATAAAVALGIPLAEADALLSSMADGSRISAELDPEGIVRYELRELRPPRRLAEAVRVEPPPGAETATPENVEVEVPPATETPRAREQR